MPDAFTVLLDAVTKIAPLKEEEIQQIRNCCTERRVKKKEIFLEAGQVCHHVYFVAQGLARTFHLNPNGSEFTRLFVQEGQFCTVLISFNEHLASPASLQAVEDSLLLEIHENDFRMLVRKFPSLQSIYLKILEDYQNFQIRRIELLTQCNPKEKIAAFHKESPELRARLSHKMISSYLQISPETYSRCLVEANLP